MTQYAAKILSGDLQVDVEIGNEIAIRLYANGGVADLSNVDSALLIVQFPQSPRDQRIFPLTIDADPTTGLVTYIPLAGDFHQPPADPVYPNINGQVKLTFNSGEVEVSTTFEMQVRTLF
jgi:hypothetical protein